MSMPPKGKHHHLPHHHHQQHHPQQQQQQQPPPPPTPQQQPHHPPAQHPHQIILNQPVVHPSQSYSAVVTSTRFLNAGSEFHGNYNPAQPGGQVGGSAANNVGVPTGRGPPPPLGGIQSIGQSAAGIPPGSTAGGQAPSQAPTPGVQPQPPQGPAPTTTPPVHTPSPQEMGKQAHLQTQPPIQPPIYVPTQNRPASQGYYPTGPTRPQQPRGISHRGGQGASGTPVVGMAGVGGGGQTTLYSHPAGLPVQATSAMYIGQSQVHGLHTGPHQQSVYPMSNQIPLQFPGPPQRHQPHQNQTYYQFQQIMPQPNVFGYSPHHPPPPQPGYFYATSGAMSLSRANTSAVSGGTQHVASPLTGTQGTPVIPQGTLQQSTQQAQPLPPMGIPLSQADMYSGHNGGATSTNSTIRSRKPRGQNAILDIVNPLTGKNISDEIYKDNETAQSGESSNSETPQPQNEGAGMIVADFAARVAKAATEGSNKVSTSASETAPNNTQTKTPLQLPVKEFQPRSEVKSATIEESSPVIPPVVANKDTISVQLTPSTANVEAATTTATATATATAIATATATVAATVAAEIEPEITRAAGAASPGIGTATGSEITKSLNASSNVIPTATVTATVAAEVEPETARATEAASPGTGTTTGSEVTKSLNVSSNIISTPVTTYWCSINQEFPKPSATASNTPVPIREPFPNLSKTSSNSPPRRKPNATELPSNTKEQKERKTREKSLGSRGTTPTPVHNQAMDHLHQKANGDAASDETETEVHLPRNEIQQKPSDGKAMQKQKSKNKLKPRELNRKGAEIEGTDMDAFVNTISTAKTVEISKDIKVATPNDVVDHAVIEEMHLEALVAQKNEENFKVSALQASNDEQVVVVTPTVLEKEEIEAQSDDSNAFTEAVTPKTVLKYSYKEDQWSPINTTGKKIYDREFLMKLQSDPHSKIKPPNLPNLQGVLKDNASNAHNTMEGMRPFKDANMTRHDSLMPVFAKANMNARPPPTSRKSDRGKPKPNKPNVIHVSLSLREDVKLRETENAWRPARLKQCNLNDEEAKTEYLYNTVRSVLNKLTPQKFSTLVDQVRHLPIDTRARLAGVIGLVFEKAVDEPSFSVEYALLCKELATMEVAGGENENHTNFKKLIITRCQKEFEKNPIEDISRIRKMKEIDECGDPEKKKELKTQFEEDERRIRIKSVGNIRFIGELYKQQMLTTKIMHRCIRHLLDQNDEDNLECLCKLLTTIGKDLELKGSVEEMQEYFNKMQEIVSRKTHSKISSRIRFMLQDVIELRANKWVPRRNDTNPKTIDQIQKEAESERFDMQVNVAPLNTPRKDDRNNDRKRNRGLGGPSDDGWSTAGRVRPATYSVETAKLKNKPPPMDDMQLGNRASYLWRANPTPSSNSKTISANKFACLENMSNLDQDKRMPPLPLSGSRSTGPRECGRDYKSYDGRSSRNGTHQSSGATSSRESHSLLDSSQGRNVSMLPPILKSASQSGAISSHKLPMTEEEFMKAYNSTLKHYLEEPIVENTGLEIQQKFDNATFGKFTRECINHVLEKSPAEQELVSKLLSHLLRRNILPLECFKNGLGEVLEIVDDLVIDIPKIWTYLAEILSHSIEDAAIPFCEMKSIFISLRNQGSCVGKFIGELLTRLSRSKGQRWVTEMWNQSGFQLINLIDAKREDVNKITKEYNLEFLTGDYNSAKDSATTELSLERIQENLTRLMKENTSFDEICSWITANVGNRDKDPKFIRHLMTAILETTLERHHGTWKLNLDTFASLQTLIQRFVDANELLELQCLYAIQRYINKIEFPPGTLVPIMNRLWMDNVISSDAFLTWQKKIPEGADVEGHSVSIVALTSFFTDLQEPDDNSSVEELSTSANQGC